MAAATKNRYNRREFITTAVKAGVASAAALSAPALLLGRRSDQPPDYFDHPAPAYNPDSDVPFHTRVERLTWKAENRTAMARTNDWKLILNESRPPELYRVAGGWIERENVASKREHRKVRQSLEQKIRDVWSW